MSRAKFKHFDIDLDAWRNIRVFMQPNVLGYVPSFNVESITEIIFKSVLMHASSVGLPWVRIL